MITGRIGLSTRKAEHIIQLLGSLYSTAGEAFKEYTTNAVDAIDERGISNGLVNITVNPTQRWVSVYDNGVGISYGRLKESFSLVGESAKEFAKTQKGEKGIGNLAYLRLKANKLIFISRNDEESSLLNLLEADPALNYRLNTVNPEHLNNVPEAIKSLVSKLSIGTIVYLEDIDQEIMSRNFFLSKLESLMSEVYTPILKKGSIDMSIGYLSRDGKTRFAKPEPLSFDGEVLLNEDDYLSVEGVKLKDGTVGTGRIDFHITLIPEISDGKVRVYHKGVKVNGDIASLEFLGKEPWNSGKLEGFVDDDFLTLNAPRNAFEFNNNLNLWLPKMYEIGESLEVQIKKNTVRKDRSSYDLADKVVQVIDKVYRDLGLGNLFRVSGPRKIVETQEKTDEEGIKKPTRVKSGGGSGARKVFPFIPDFEGFGLSEAKLRSKLVGKVIKVNTNHSDYEKYFKNKDEFERADYLLDIMSKEVGFAAAKTLLTRETEERPSVEDIILKTKEIASDIYYNSQRQLRLDIKGKL